MIACDCIGPRLHAQPSRVTSRNGWSPTFSITVASPRGIRLKRAWNSPQRLWSGVKLKPATGWTLSLGSTFCDRDKASQTEPRSIAAHAPPAKTTSPRADTGAVVSRSNRRAASFIAVTLIRRRAERHCREKHPKRQLNQPILLFNYSGVVILDKPPDWYIVLPYGERSWQAHSQHRTTTMRTRRSHMWKPGSGRTAPSVRIAVRGSAL